MRILRIISIILLGLNGIGAFIGSWPMMMDPNGRIDDMKIEWLEWPFHNYLIRGFALFTFIGCFSFLAMIITIMRKSAYPLFIAMEGFFLTVWISIQLVFFRERSWMQPTCLVIGLGFLYLGYLQKQSK